MQKLKYIVAIITVFILLLVSQGCKKEITNFDFNQDLAFSTDTVQFDTVFTTLGSTTKAFKVYNTSSSPIQLENIRLVGGQTSQFRLNIDGDATTSVNNVTIEGGDSLFIFVEVTVDPNNNNTPFVIADSVEFTGNEGNSKHYVKLVAWGQNANYFYPDSNQSNDEGFRFINILDCNNNVWNNDKPYVIFGTLVVPDGCQLTINAGCQIHFYTNSSLYVAPGGSIIVNGTAENKVVFQATRLEQELENSPGQWGNFVQFIISGSVFRAPVGGIFLDSASTGNIIDHAIIKNGIIGLQLRKTAELTLTNTEIINHNSVGLQAENATINGYNIVTANCGGFCSVFQGGTYNFRHFTAANYWSGSTARQTPAFVVTNYTGSSDTPTAAPLNFSFKNSIVYGNIETEYVADMLPITPANFNFENTILKVKADVDLSNPANYTDIIKNPSQTFIFRNTFESDYSLDSTATNPAINAGKESITNSFPQIQFDIKGNPRINENIPDLGAYEGAIP